MSGSQLLLLGGTPQVVSDPNFEYTTLLLPGNGTNGAQNNTFLDSSTNAFSITRNGNTTQGTFSPFSQTGWGAYFNGSSDYISVADSADFTMGSGDFTVQCWVYSTANSGSDQYILGQVNSGGTAAATSFQLYKKATSNVAEAFVYAGATKVATGTAQIPVGQWTHLAMVRDGGTLRLYVNGSQDGTNATLSTTAITDSAGSFSVGRTGDYNGLYFAGYVSNVSVVKGTCLFPSGTTFTPSTTPLSTSTSGQSVLLCQANRFIDTNTATTAKTVTVGSTSSIQAFSPFNPTAAWSAATNGGSGYFDGSGDYLVTPSNTAFAPGSGDWTFEGWFYATVKANRLVQFSDDNGNLTFNRDGVSNLGAYINGVDYSFGSTPTNSWVHFAISVTSGTCSGYLNGTRVFNFAGGSATSSARSFSIGAGTSGADPFTGYISNLRYVKGTGVYSGTTITVPTAPLTAITNTSLLCNFTNAGIYDATSKNDLETVGNAQISTTQSKFGGSSMYFDGTGDYLVCNAATNNLYAFGTGDFTLEMWVYFNSVASGSLFEFRPASTNGAYPLIYFSSSGVLTYYANSNPQINSSSVSTGQWYHIALCRYGTATKMYLNGIQTGSTYTDSSNYLCRANGPLIGVTSSLSSDFLNGYVDDFRITKGVARYTANFTPPTVAFPLL